MNLLPKGLLIYSKTRLFIKLLLRFYFSFRQTSLNASRLLLKIILFAIIFKSCMLFLFYLRIQLFVISILFYSNVLNFKNVLILFKDSCLFNFLLQVLEVMYRALQCSELRLLIKRVRDCFSSCFVYKHTHLLTTQWTWNFY